jgi:chromosome segregation ATPase
MLVDSYYKKKTLVHKIKNINFKYQDLKTSFKYLFVEHKQKETNCNQLEDVLKDVERENDELKIKIKELQEAIKTLKEPKNSNVIHF